MIRSPLSIGSNKDNRRFLLAFYKTSIKLFTKHSDLNMFHKQTINSWEDFNKGNYMGLVNILDQEIEQHERQRTWEQFCQIIAHSGKKRILKKHDTSRGPFELLHEVCNEVLEQFRQARGKTSWN